MSELDCDKQTKEIKVSANSAPIDTTCEKEAIQTACHSKDRVRLTSDLTESPWNPSHFMVHEKLDLKKILELLSLRSAQMAKSFPNEIIIPDPTPKHLQDAFYDRYHSLVPVLKKDSVRCFLHLFGRYPGMAYKFSITSETLTCMISHGALRCAKAVLEGKAPELHCRHANPNCMNPHGYFPLHEAAERFSVDMIKLLFRHGASANVRTIGDAVIADLLPLHVAVENTCMHKYLEDNLSPVQYQRDYTYKLIHLLCLPEMKIFLDTVRLLAEKTDNLVDELWNYIRDRKLVQTSVLLLAAQKQFRKHDWFNTIMYRIWKDSYPLSFKEGDTDVQQLEETFHLVSIISHAGEALDKYIQAHSEVAPVPHMEVLEHVSSILKEFGFCPKDCIDVRNLRPYNCKISFVGVYEPALRAAVEKALRKKVQRGWDPTYTRRSFFPYWRSILGARCEFRVYPSYAAEDYKYKLDLERIRNRMGNKPSSIQNHNTELIGRIQQMASSTSQSRTYSTATFKALRKMLKNA